MSFGIGKRILKRNGRSVVDVDVRNRLINIFIQKIHLLMTVFIVSVNNVEVRSIMLQRTNRRKNIWQKRIILVINAERN